jgi:hypothetical protein
VISKVYQAIMAQTSIKINRKCKEYNFSNFIEEKNYTNGKGKNVKVECLS